MKKTTIPSTLEECTQQDAYAKKISDWSDRIETFGMFILYFLVIAGLIISVSSSFVEEIRGTYYTYTETVFNVGIFFTSLLTWSIYAVIEYCIYHAISLLLGALASIVQNTKVSASVSLYNASKKLIENQLEDSSNKTELINLDEIKLPKI